MDLNYYWSDSFDELFYIKLAQAGFISTSMTDVNDNPILLPEIQFEYAVLHFDDLHISKKVNKLLREKQFIFNKTEKVEQLIEHINNYHEISWLSKEYQQMLSNIATMTTENFEVVGFELLDKNKRLIAGEVGYIIGHVYTSLSGFCTKEKAYNNWGKLQLVLLSHYLKENKFDFWNLGHASLQYKLDLGAKVYKRDQFLKLWKTSTHI